MRLSDNIKEVGDMDKRPLVRLRLVLAPSVCQLASQAPAMSDHARWLTQVRDSATVR